MTILCELQVDYYMDFDLATLWKVLELENMVPKTCIENTTVTPA